MLPPLSSPPIAVLRFAQDAAHIIGSRGVIGRKSLPGDLRRTNVRRTFFIRVGIIYQSLGKSK